ncbi:MAG: hypothetical protein E7439_03795 [Ruminococcaceae bacterium]|nr:hypothetical protein [Oscillospiraceae bacterium]
MEHWKLTQWCTRAVSKIRYTPDRRDVYNELRQHINDRCESFLAQGMGTEEAVNKAVEVMGDPRELAKQLGAIHRPFWGFACSISKWVMRFAVVIAVLSVLSGTFQFLWENYITPSSKYDNGFSDSIFSPVEDPSITRTMYAEPNCSVTSDGYTFTATRATALQRTSLYPTGYIDRRHILYIEMKVQKNLRWYPDCWAFDWFWATDSLGNTYSNYRANDLNCVDYSYNGESSIFQIRLETTEKIDWVELHYDRDGRDLVWHIDLTGGDQI